jgi:hypothetical protein
MIQTSTEFQIAAATFVLGAILGQFSEHFNVRRVLKANERLISEQRKLIDLLKRHIELLEIKEKHCVICVNADNDTCKLGGRENCQFESKAKLK